MTSQKDHFSFDSGWMSSGVKTYMGSKTNSNQKNIKKHCSQTCKYGRYIYEMVGRSAQASCTRKYIVGKRW